MVYRRTARRRFVLKSRRAARMRAILLSLFAVAIIVLVISVMLKVSPANMGKTLPRLVPHIPSASAAMLA